MPNLITLETKLSSIQGILPKFLDKLTKLGILTVYDLLWHFPSRYEDYSTITKIADLRPGQMVTIRAEVRRVALRRSFKSSMFVTEATVTDETGGITLIWFNQAFIAKTLTEGMRVNFAGKVFQSKTGLHISNPSYEIIRGTSATTHTAGLIPVYPETRGLTSKGLRSLVKTFLEIIKTLPDFLPEAVRVEHNLPELNTALRHIHFPKNPHQAEQAKLRFAFEYVFLMQLNNLRAKAALAKEHAPPLAIDPAILQNFLQQLPFTLTESQLRSLHEILLDIERPQPMNRLLQGDVGSGKTVIAALAALVADHNKKQSVFMAPTEVLAKQHYATCTTLFPSCQSGIALITGSEARVFYGKGLETKKPKAAVLKDIAAGKISIIIGTHALITAEGKQTARSKSRAAKTQKLAIKFAHLGLVIIDEQHRFGVRQRQALLGKKSSVIPHFLSMSATPIPRTLSLAVFGDLDVSTINELPKGRKAIITKIVAPENRPKAYGFIKQHIDAGRQAFFIYPRIEEQTTDNERLTTTLMTKNTKSIFATEMKAVKAEYERLATKVFPQYEVAMLHGKMSAADKHKVMTDFKSGRIQILVSTSVIEVGIDVPNATVMVIEGAERFGLSQLYQFRGRVGRGQHQSFCLLFTDSNSESTIQRLQALIEAKNGFELAEKDLELRGPGQFLGDKQTGMPDATMQSLTNMELVKAARDSAQKIIASDPDLAHQPLLRERALHFGKDVHLE